mmetsp:Transcript_14983/g.21275  ORF Transcript_14983/g.21275 Transcript_14983/m.21275 type:complete len:133 (+) Transcript_14983:68-466(+)
MSSSRLFEAPHITPVAHKLMTKAMTVHQYAGPQYKRIGEPMNKQVPPSHELEDVVNGRYPPSPPKLWYQLKLVAMLKVAHVRTVETKARPVAAKPTFDPPAVGATIARIDATKRMTHAEIVKPWIAMILDGV